MNGIFLFLSRFLTFYLFFVFDISFVEARPHLFIDKPEGCSAKGSLATGCAVSSGDSPYGFVFEDNKWEMAKQTVLIGESERSWKVALGTFVVKAQEPQVIKTPFGEIRTGKSEVLVELEKDRVVVSVLKGESVEFQPRSNEPAQFLAEGFQNWFSGLAEGSQVTGIPKVIDLEVYAQKRAHFFVDHKLGFVNELKSLAGIVQKASQVAAQIHENLVAGKVGLLEEKFEAGVRRHNQQIQYNKKLQRMFRRKMRYDD